MGRATPSRLPAGPRSSAVVQTLWFWTRAFPYLQRCRRRYGSRFTLRATSHPPLVFLSDPHEINAVMTAPEELLRPGEGGAAVAPIVGDESFMLSDGEAHRVSRKSMVSALDVRAVERHADMISAVTERAIRDWPLNTVIALHPRLRSLTLEVILRTLTGRLTGSAVDRVRLLHDRVLAMLSVTASPAFVEPRLRHGPGGRTWQDFLRHRAQVDELLYALIDEQSAVRQVKRSPHDLLGLLTTRATADGPSVARQQARDNIMSLILAGHETTASQLAWAFQLLAHNPTVRDRLVREIDAGLSEEYLIATIQEVLRHRCVFVFAIPRALAKPVEIGGWGYEPPAHLLPCIYLVHHDPRFYPDPHVFRPERFLQAPPSPRTWLPWGGGRKRCPGLHLATLEMKTVLRTILANMTVEPAGGRIEHPRWRSVIITPHAGSRVVLRARSRTATLS